MLLQEELIIVLNKALNQKGHIRKGTDVVYYCPVCKHYKKKLEISLVTGKYHCWVCGFSGLCLDTLFSKLKIPRHLYSGFKNVRPKSYEPKKYETILTLPSEFKQFSFSENFDFEHNSALSYLRKRCVTDVDILRYNIGYCESGEYHHRIIIPSYDENGLLNFFSARSYINSSYAYKLCESTKDIIGFENLINFDYPITLVEGQFDALSVRYNAIPLFGKSLSKKLKSKLVERKVKKVNVLLDNDALPDSIKICEFLLKNNIDPYIVLLNKKDPSVLGFNDVTNLIDKSQKIDFGTLLKLKMKCTLS